MGESSPSNNYEIQNLIGSGQFSDVFKVRRKDDSTLFAMKKVKGLALMDEKLRNDCLKEVDILQKISEHPNIIKYYESWVENNELYIIMELAELGDLSRVLNIHAKNNKPLEEAVIWNIFVQIASGIKYMHENKIIHRDLKPANIFITGDGVMKLGDLGMGRIMSSKTMAHSLVGTPYYMSPERIKEGGYSYESDLWSLGCILYEMAALKSPFYEERLKLYALCEKIARCEYDPLPDVYSDKLKNLVARILQADPKKRPTFTEIHEIAESCLEDNDDEEE